MRQILEGLIAGLTMKEIAEGMGVHSGCLSSYLSPAKWLYNCRTTHELVVEYFKWRQADEQRNAAFRELEVASDRAFGR